MYDKMNANEDEELDEHDGTVLYEQVLGQKPGQAGVREEATRRVRAV